MLPEVGWGELLRHVGDLKARREKSIGGGVGQLDVSVFVCFDVNERWSAIVDEG